MSDINFTFGKITSNRGENKDKKQIRSEDFQKSTCFKHNLQNVPTAYNFYFYTFKILQYCQITL